MLRIDKTEMASRILALAAVLALVLGVGLAFGEETTDQEPGSAPASQVASAETGQAAEPGTSGCESGVSAIDRPSPSAESGELCLAELPETADPFLAGPVFQGPPLRRYCRCSCGAIQCQSSDDCGGAPCQAFITCC